MDWLLLLIFAYLFIAVAFLIDKFIVTKVIPEPAFYTVVISTMGLSAFVLTPWGLSWPSLYPAAKAALAGGSFTLAVFFLYHAMRSGEASRVVTLVGALGAVTTFVLSFLFLDQRLGLFQNIAFGLLILGGVLVTFETKRADQAQSWIWQGLTAALLFGISYTAIQSTYDSLGFSSGFIWSRVFAFLFALMFLIPKNNRGLIKKNLAGQSNLRQGKNQLLVLSSQVLNGVGFIILNYVVFLASAAIVLAAQGLQYVFVLILTLVLGRKLPGIFKEKYSAGILAQKVFAILLIAVGLVFLSITPV